MPNILVIMTDQHSKKFLGCYGNDLVRTPNLDKLSSEGMRFDNAYCPSPLCVPSRMSFMTTRTPSSNEVWDNEHTLNSGIPTWANVMSNAGYETALLGRMHFNGPDQRHGFEIRPIGEPSAGHLGMKSKGGERWTKFPGSTSGQIREGIEIAGKGKTHYQWQDEECTRVAKNWLLEKVNNKSSRPFAAVLGYVLPHCPFVAPKELFDYYYERVKIPVIEEDQPETIKRFRKVRGIDEPKLSDEKVRVALASYYGLCEYIDFLIGQVLDTLEETGLDKNTVVVYTTDHGEMAGDHGCWWKSNYYEGSVGVPLIVRYPGVTPPVSKSDLICNLMDLGPTFSEIAGVKYPCESDGHSLLKILQGEEDEDFPDETFSELVDFKGGKNYPSRMIRSGPWKLWFFDDEEKLPPVLFNLKEDPDEKNDLGLDPNYSAIRKELLEKVYLNWNPQENRIKSIVKDKDAAILKEWAKKTNPDAPDAMVLPSAEIENDVELL